MTAVEKYHSPATALVDWGEAAKAAHQLAVGLVETRFAPEQFHKKPLEATAAILAGAEVGLSPMQALQSTYVIGGKPAYYARTMVALVQRQGHEVWTEKETPASVTVCGQRQGSDKVEQVTVTLDQARKAGWTRNKQYDTNPTSMLWARAASRVCRRVAADALLGIPYSVEELTDEDAAPEPTRTVRRGVKPQVPDAPAIEAPAASESESDPAPQEPTQDTLTGDDDA